MGRFQLAIWCFFSLANFTAYGYKTCVDWTVDGFCKTDNVICNYNGPFHPCPAKCKKCTRPNPVPQEISLKDSCLDVINNKRRLHQDTPDIEWDFVHEADAQNCAKDFHECYKNVHYYGAIYFELMLPNLSSIKDVCRITVNQVHDEWKRYTYKKPNMFSQLVWKLSQKVGVGIHQYGHTFYLVFFFTQPGNVGSQIENVMPFIENNNRKLQQKKLNEKIEVKEGNGDERENEQMNTKNGKEEEKPVENNDNKNHQNNDEKETKSTTNENSQQMNDATSFESVDAEPTKVTKENRREENKTADFEENQERQERQRQEQQRQEQQRQEQHRQEQQRQEQQRQEQQRQEQQRQEQQRQEQQRQEQQRQEQQRQEQQRQEQQRQEQRQQQQTTTTTPTQTTTEEGVGLTKYQFRELCLKEHYIRRVKHKDTRPLEYSVELENLSQQWADHLIDIGTIKHNYTSPYGENLFVGWGVVLSDEISIKKSLIGWYDDEINFYYNKYFGMFHERTGHFTQVVWKNTKQVGCALSRKETRVIVVCKYNPPGNYLGQFNDQVGGRL